MANSTSYFWSEEDGTKGVDTDRLTKINDYLYYGTIVDDEGDVMYYSTYSMGNNLRGGYLAEEGYYGKFKCTTQSRSDIEAYYNMSFAPYYNN